MVQVQRSSVPLNTMLDACSKNGAYVDCYMSKLPGRVTFSDFIYVFYTTPLFRLERKILAVSVSKPSTDAQARQLADGNIETFAAWRVENRSEDEILLCDFVGRTRSWLMTVTAEAHTTLYFGSAVVSVPDKRTRKQSLGFGFKSLLMFHKVYSVLLLYSAAAKLRHKLSTVS